MTEKKNKDIEAFEAALDDVDNPSGNPPLSFEGKTLTNCSFKALGSPANQKALLCSADFKDTVIKSCTFTGVRFDNAQFDGASLEYVKFVDCFFDTCTFIGTAFEKTTIKSYRNSSNCNFTDASFNDCLMYFSGGKINIKNIHLSNSTIYISFATVLDFSNALVDNNSTLTIESNSHDDNYNFVGSKIINSKIIDSHFEHSLFENADLSNSEIIDCKFIKCDFQSTLLYGIELSNETIFKSTNFKNSSIDRYTLECIPLELIPNSSRVKMNCIDDVAKLRLMYSGVYGYINIILLLTFIFPYCWFVVKMWSEARFTQIDNIESITLIGALGRFITSGGTSWQNNWEFLFLPISIFAIALVYNISRFILLAKTISLEHKEKISNLPVKFSINAQPWFFVYNTNKILFYINLIAVILHSIHFSLQKVPTGIG